MESQISQFVAVTGGSEKDGRALLEACAGDLGMAIDMYLDSERQGGVVSGTRPGSSPTVEESYEAQHGVRAPIPQTSGVLIEEDPTSSRSLRSRRLPATVFDPFQDYSRVSQKGKSREKLAELFKPPFDLMFVGTFEELRTAGQTNKRWLLVNVQDSKQFASQVLNRDVWSHEEVRTILCKHFLFWQVHSITDDGLKIKQLYNVDTFPYIALLDPRTGEKMMDWERITASKLVAGLKEFLRNNAFDDDRRVSKDEGMPAEMTEEEQLQTAIRVSLERRESHSQDPYQLNGDSDECVSLCSGDEAEAIELGREELDDGSFREGTFTRTAAASGADICILSDLKRTNPRGNGSLSTNMNSRKRKSSTSEDTSVPSQKMARFQEPTFHSQPCHGPLGRKGKERAATGVVAVEEKLRTGELHKDEVSEVVVRLPDGTRLQKAFLGSSPIMELYSYLSERGINSSHDIVTNFPRRSLKDLDHFLTFREAGLCPSVTVYVQD